MYSVPVELLSFRIGDIMISTYISFAAGCFLFKLPSELRDASTSILPAHRSLVLWHQGNLEIFLSGNSPLVGPSHWCVFFFKRVLAKTFWAQAWRETKLGWKNRVNLKGWCYRLVRPTAESSSETFFSALKSFRTEADVSGAPLNQCSGTSGGPLPTVAVPIAEYST